MAHADGLNVNPTEAGARIDVRECKQIFGNYTALHKVDLAVAGGEFVTLLGPSGSGKTTLLRILAGLIMPTGGTVEVAGQEITYLPSEKRDIGMVFQNYALFPHMTIFNNVAFPLSVRRFSRDEIRTRVNEALALVGLPRHGERYPGQLSGGQQQRVAIARALVFHPRVLLMDEPLGSLDKGLRQQLQLEIRRLQKEIGITTVYVTHDQDEAFTISDRIAVMNGGEILQIAPPAEIYRNPATRFVADFVGELNSLNGRVDHGPATSTLTTPGGVAVQMPACDHLPDGSDASLCVRPEHLVVTPADGAAVGAVLNNVRFKGDHLRGEAILSDGSRMTVHLPEHSPLQDNARIGLSWPAERAHVFAA